MKKLIVSILMLFLSVVYILGAKVGTLPQQVLKPEMIRVFDNNVYVLEGASISVISLKDMRFIRKFGKIGEGPGELQVVPFYSIVMHVFPQYILVDSFNKLIHFSHEGKVIKEIKKTTEIKEVLPIGKKFVAKKFQAGENGMQFTAVILYNSNLEEIKELYKQTFPVSKGRIEVIPDSLNFCVENNKVFIDRSPEGFVIDVFDSEGKKLYQIKKDYKKIKVTEALKNSAIEWLKNDPMVKQFGSMERVKSVYKLEFPEYLPAIESMVTSSRKICIGTFNKKDNKEKCLVMDFKGNQLQELYVPQLQRRKLVDEQFGLARYFYSIDNNKFYYLIENEDDEEWEIHALELK